ncbi:MAG: efflux RND transporter periplasmic adaptor subunit [Verrucomicrobiae bacterium]|nr:efflux RND transporter periplasmic adaptor subunit [Verrucomicrobiae bacterium]
MNQSAHSIDQLALDRGAGASRRGGWWIWILLVLAVSGAAGVWLFRGSAAVVRTSVARAEERAGAPAVLNASGYVVARRESAVAAKVTGKVVEVSVEEGMAVEAGRVLAKLDDTNVRAALRVAEAELEAARAAVGEIQARLEESEKQWRRMTELAKNQVVSPADIDKAEADVQSLRARLLLQQAQMGVAAEQVKLRQQDVEDMVIRAPFAGIVVSKDAQPGEMISPISAGGGFTRTGIATLVDTASLEIEVDVNESFINLVKPEQRVEATLDAYPDWSIPCKVLAIIPTADRQKATVRVRVAFDRLDPRVLPQMAVRVAFLGDRASNGRGAIIPAGALRREGTHSAVWVVVGGRLQRRAVEVGAVAGEEATLLSGVAPGEAVVVEGPEELLEGGRARERDR